LKLEPLGYPETSVDNYESTPCNITEEQRSHIEMNRKAVRCEKVDWIHPAEVHCLLRAIQ